MAKLITTLSVNMTGLQPMFDCLASLGEALDVAQFDGEIDVVATKEGLAFNGVAVAAISFSSFKRGTSFMRATPTFRMPLFSTEICRLVPGVKVRWEGGWPHFSANDGDDPCEDGPDPVTPERVLA